MNLRNSRYYKVVMTDHEERKVCEDGLGAWAVARVEDPLSQPLHQPVSNWTPRDLDIKKGKSNEL